MPFPGQKLDRFAAGGSVAVQGSDFFVYETLICSYLCPDDSGTALVVFKAVPYQYHVYAGIWLYCGNQDRRHPEIPFLSLRYGSLELFFRLRQRKRKDFY